MRTPRDAYPGAQTCMGSNMVRVDFGSGLIRPRAQTCCAELRRLARLANSPGFKSFRCPRWRIKFSLERFSDSVAHLFAYPAVEKFCRASSAGGRRHLQQNFANQIVSVAEDCLSPAGSFHGCSLMHFRGCFRGSNSDALQLACPAVEKFCRASSAGGRLNL